MGCDSCFHFGNKQKKSSEGTQGLDPKRMEVNSLGEIEGSEEELEEWHEEPKPEIPPKESNSPKEAPKRANSLDNPEESKNQRPTLPQNESNSSKQSKNPQEESKESGPEPNAQNFFEDQKKINQEQIVEKPNRVPLVDNSSKNSTEINTSKKEENSLNQENNSFKESKTLCEAEMEGGKFSGFLLNFSTQEKGDYYFIADISTMKDKQIDKILYKGTQITFYYDNKIKNCIYLGGQINRKIKVIKENGLNLLVIGLFNQDTINDLNNFLFPFFPKDKEEIKNIKEITIGENENFQIEIEKLSENGFSFKVINEYKGQIKPGFPILLKESKKVIGFIKTTNQTNNEYEAAFISLIKMVEEKFEQFYGYFGNYFGKATQNGIPDKKGLYQFQNKESYLGDIVLDNFHGKGIYEYCDCYYIGQFNNNLREGKGIIYYPNGNIVYEGDFVNDQFHGNGIFCWVEGEYYIGQFQNGKNNGKGILYYKDGKIKYEGDFVNDKFEGQGTYYYENGYIYEGKFKEGLKDGEGTLYTLHNGDKKIVYEGNFEKGTFNGKGKYIYENGNYYIGEFKNGVCHGKGVEFDKNGNKLSEGVWENDEKK